MSGQHGTDLVRAAQAGDPWARDQLVGAYLPLVYNIVGRALNGGHDVDDVVQDTMLRALDGLGTLRAPDSFRSWLVAIAMNAIRSHWHDRQTGLRTGVLDEARELAQPGGDFVDLTVVRLNLSGQRRETAEATRWLEPDDSALLSLWWLECAGQLTRYEVAVALDLSTAHTAVRVQRMKEQLEAARIVVRAVAQNPPCPTLHYELGGWDGRPSALWRKRISRHARGCARCAGLWSGLVPAEGLLAGLLLVPPAAVLLAAVREGASGLGLAGAYGATGPGAGYDTYGASGSGAGYDTYGASGSGAGYGTYGAGAGYDTYGAGAYEPYGSDAAYQPYGAGETHEFYAAQGSGEPYEAGQAYAPHESGQAHASYESAALYEPYEAGAVHEPYETGVARESYEAAPEASGTAAVPSPVGGGRGGRGARRRQAEQRRRDRRRAVVAAGIAVVAVTGGSFYLGSGRDEDVTTVDAADTPSTGSGLSVAPAEASASSAVPTSPTPSASPTPTKKPSPTATPSAKPKPKVKPSVRPTTQPPRPRPTREATSGGGGSSSAAQQVVALVNSERSKAGCGPVTGNALLDRAAQGHSEDMAARDFFDHTNPDGDGPGERVTAAGYRWSTYGENIAMGQRTPQDVMNSWMNSPGHRANILNCSFKEIGIGIHNAGGPYWTQVFGAR
ncbi:sigma-70 family RNA polymerase sigma factor [Streptomyces sp. NPDC048604]|uniref:sigma-70 family RNA polymerase sigma factor n=1 Tax=Streptomyces sp. NPDC048604 TaxID=3365578 RepID=UPI00371E86DF